MKVQFVAGFGPIVRDLQESARFYRDALGLPLPEGDYVATDDLPGVKHFGLWNVTRDNLVDHFPDVAAGTAPPWRKESYERILESLPQPAH